MERVEREGMETGGMKTEDESGRNEKWETVKNTASHFFSLHENG